MGWREKIMDYYGIVKFLKNIGVFEFYLPFVILFGLLFGLLEKSKIIPERRINIIIALASAFFIMAYTPAGITLTQFFSNFFANVAAIMVTLLSFVLMIYLIIPITGKKEPQFPKAAKYVAFFIALIVIGIFITSGGLAIFLPQLAEAQIPVVGIEIDPQDLVIIFLIIIMIAVIYFVSKEEKEKEPETKYVPVPVGV
ncbi:MAG: hypothetical protein NZ942_01390 [Candidatus Aenigmarchaeota archaeon]|nr:hypothetical protein [Candidatus Aenigmarchaeota archaeon]